MVITDEAVIGIEEDPQMDGTEFQVSLERLRGCIGSCDNDEIENVVTDLDLLTIEVERWPDGFFDGLEGLLRDPYFIGLAKSWTLFYFIANNWEQISEPEQERLREVLGQAFDKCGDWMGPFVIGEILGDRYADETTLAILEHLAKTANLLARQLLPHTLEHLAKATNRESLRSQAIQQLQGLRKSDSKEVRDEAFTSLAKLGISPE
jgi:hypothetical protein